MSKSRQILYSAEAMKAASNLSEALYAILIRESGRRARRDGRSLVTAEDVFAALEEIGIAEGLDRAIGSEGTES